MSFPKSVSAAVSAKVRACSPYRWSWIVTLLVTFLGGFFRFVDLGRFPRVVFDETYYVKDAYALWHLGHEADWPKNVDARFSVGDYSMMPTEPASVVHPQTGKWLIAAGMELFGPTSSFGWRFASALAGTLCVLFVARLAWQLFGSVLVTALAGVFLSLDGVAISMSRTALLDIFLTLFVLIAFWAVAHDMRSATPKLEARLRAYTPPAGVKWWKRLGPNAGQRPWLIVAGVSLGLATSVKWSGIYALAVVGIFVFARECTVRFRFGLRPWFPAAVIRDGLDDFFLLVPVALLTYLASWWSWFLHPGSWGRGASGGTGLLATWQDFVTYHLQMWQFHQGVTSEHPYASHPASWLFQIRPTSFVYYDVTKQVDCGGPRCIEAVLCLGNPLLWWVGVLALLLVIITAFWWRDRRMWLILAGYLAMYAPWFLYAKRTIFAFYTVAFVPFVALSTAVFVGMLWGVVIEKPWVRYQPPQPDPELDSERESDLKPEPEPEPEPEDDAAADGLPAVEGEEILTGEAESEAALVEDEAAGAVAATRANEAGKIVPVAELLAEVAAADETVSPAAAPTTEAATEQEAASADEASEDSPLPANTPFNLALTWSGRILGASIVLAIVIIGGIFMPLWIGSPIPHSYWHSLMWLQSWI